MTDVSKLSPAEMIALAEQRRRDGVGQRLKGVVGSPIDAAKERARAMLTQPNDVLEQMPWAPAHVGTVRVEDDDTVRLVPAPYATVIEHVERPLPEKEVQRAVRQLYLEAGCDVYWLSQARKTGQTPGLPDLYVFHERAGASWWHEVKPATGDLTDAQREFQRRCGVTRTRHVTGGVEAARLMLTALGITLSPLP